VVLAGDFSVSTQCERSADNEASAVFARLRAWRMVDSLRHTRSSRPRLEGCGCPEADDCAHVQTFRSGAQLDYAFVSQSLLPALSGCHVEATEAAWNFSDHCPIVLDLQDLPGQ
jgi:exonuclease III